MGIICLTSNTENTGISKELQRVTKKGQALRNQQKFLNYRVTPVENNDETPEDEAMSGAETEDSILSQHLEEFEFPRRRKSLEGQKLFTPNENCPTKSMKRQQTTSVLDYKKNFAF
jgi:hypothetical protein